MFDCKAHKIEKEHDEVFFFKLINFFSLLQTHGSVFSTKF